MPIPGPPPPPAPGSTPHEEGDVALDERVRTRQPRRYAVLLHNDDYTTMEFVVEVLMRHFHKDETEATHIMLSVHHKGKGLAGTYTRDVAETKVEQATSFARASGYPLRLTAEPEGTGGDGDD